MNEEEQERKEILKKDLDYAGKQLQTENYHLAISWLLIALRKYFELD